MGFSDEAATRAVTWMSISSGRLAWDLAGAIGRLATSKVEELPVGVVGDNVSGKKAERG